MWIGASGGNVATAGNWNDITAGPNPAASAPGTIDTAAFLSDGGIVTGTDTVSVLQLGSGGLWSLGSGASLTAASAITVSSGIVEIDAGASIVGKGTLDTISGTGPASASVLVSGATAAWHSAGTLLVGGTGGGNLSISGGGTVITGAAGATIANTSTGSGSSVTVTGTGSGWTIGGLLTVGGSGTGSLNIASGGTVSASSLDAAARSGGDGVIAVSGAGSALTLSGSLTLGGVGAGELSILGGATVSAQALTVDNASTLSSGNLDVEGSGSTLTIGSGGLLQVGVSGGGSGVLTIGSGSTLSFNGSIIEAGRASFNNNGGVVDPDSIEFTSPSNAGAGLNEYDLYVGNTGAVQITPGTGTWDTPMVLTGTSVAEAPSGRGT